MIEKIFGDRKVENLKMFGNHCSGVMVNVIAIGAGGLVFYSRADQIGHSVVIFATFFWVVLPKR